jgi:hypothetical protein
MSLQHDCFAYTHASMRAKSCMPFYQQGSCLWCHLVFPKACYFCICIHKQYNELFLLSWWSCSSMSLFRALIQYVVIFSDMYPTHTVFAQNLSRLRELLHSASPASVRWSGVFLPARPCLSFQSQPARTLSTKHLQAWPMFSQSCSRSVIGGKSNFIL